MKISVVVTVYNDQTYLAQCVQSLLDQTYEDYEIILIDDGSTDDSGAYCDQYAKMHAQVRVIHSQNQGVGAARNLGVKNACGELITFVDADDFVGSDYLSQLASAHAETGAEITLVNNNELHEANGTFYFFLPATLKGTQQLLTPKQAIEYQSSFPYNPPCFVRGTAKLAPRELYLTHPFPEGMMFEDEASTHQLYLAVEKIAVVHQDPYTYRVRPNSIVTGPLTDQRTLDLLRAFQIKVLDLVMAGIDVGPVKARLSGILQTDLATMIAQGRGDSLGSQEYQRLLKIANVLG